MPTGIYVRTEKHIKIIQETMRRRIGIRRVRYEVDKNGCWIWKNANDGRGYGTIRVSGKTIKAYRYFYEKNKGPVSAGLELDHLCKTKLCVNPDHLEQVPHAVNMQRALGIYSHEIIRMMRSMVDDGFNRSELSRLLAIPHRTVCNIVSGDRWANIV